VPVALGVSGSGRLKLVCDLAVAYSDERFRLGLLYVHAASARRAKAERGDIAVLIDVEWQRARRAGAELKESGPGRVVGAVIVVSRHRCRVLRLLNRARGPSGVLYVSADQIKLWHQPTILVPLTVIIATLVGHIAQLMKHCRNRAFFPL
jgi:hypothetical protein